MVVNSSNSTTARQAIDRALAAVQAARAHQGPCQKEADAASAALEGCQVDIQAIKFDRPDKDVSAHGRAIRGRATSSVEHEKEAKTHQEGITSSSGAIDEGIQQALAAVGNNGQARWQLEEAARDLGFMNTHDLKALDSDLRLGAKNLGPDLAPYLGEVEADGPGRDVGRFAEDIKRLVDDGNLSFREAGLAAGWVLKDLNSIQGHLDLAKQSLKR